MSVTPGLTEIDQHLARFRQISFLFGSTRDLMKAHATLHHQNVRRRLARVCSRV
jgi:hypothetical protein